MTTKIKNLQNKINDKNLSIEEREDRFLDLQILEIQEEEKQDNYKIRLNRDRLNYILKNLNINNYEFKFYEKRDHNDNYNCCIFVKCEEYETYINNIYYYDEYEYINLMTNEEINILKEYQKNKYFNDDEENEI